MDEQDEDVIPSEKEYSQALHSLKGQFSETDLRVLRELYRSRDKPLPLPTSELARILGESAEAANEVCFRLARLLQVALSGKYAGLQPSATSSAFSAPKLDYQWRMDLGLARGMELADLLSPSSQ